MQRSLRQFLGIALWIAALSAAFRAEPACAVLGAIWDYVAQYQIGIDYTSS